MNTRNEREANAVLVASVQPMPPSMIRPADPFDCLQVMA